MYVALQKMPLRLADLSVKMFQPGDPIEDFDAWPEWTREAMLKGRMVRWAPQGVSEGELTQLRGRSKVVQHVPPGPLPKFVDEPLLPSVPMYVPTPSTNDYIADNQSLPAKLQTIATEVPAEDALSSTLKEALAPAPPGGGQVKVTRQPDATGALDCTFEGCNRQGFKDFTGLRIHMAKAHKQS